jgi:hypothetical protein
MDAPSQRFRRRVKHRGKSLVNGCLYGRGVGRDLLVHLERRWNRQSCQLLAIMIPSENNKITENKNKFSKNGFVSIT